MLQSKGAVREIFPYKGKILIAFPKHDGLFHVDGQHLLDVMRQAHAEGREVSFTFDASLKILSIDPGEPF